MFLLKRITLLICFMVFAIFLYLFASNFFLRIYKIHLNGTLNQFFLSNIKNYTFKPRRIIAENFGLIEVNRSVDDYSIRNSLPEFLIIPAISTENLTPSGNEVKNDPAGWSHSFGDYSSAKYSSLDQINQENVGSLGVAWMYKSEGIYKALQATPIYTGNAVVFPDSSDRIVAVDPETGNPIWRFDPGIAFPAKRGMTYVSGDNDKGGRIYFAAGGRVYCLSSADGKPVSSFSGGSVSIGYESKIAPVVSGGKLIVASVKPAIHVYDADNGKLIREISFYDYFNHRGFLGELFSLPPDYGGGAPWGGMSFDVNRQIVYVTTSNPTPVGVGVGRQGDNKPTSSVLAFSVVTGELLWSFQDVRHDLWDLDIAAPPVLVVVNRMQKQYDAVAVATKSGNLLLLDRVTGGPLFDFRLRRAPVSLIPGEFTSPYQPDPLLPEPFARTAFTVEDVTNIAPINREFVINSIQDFSMGFYPPHVPGKKTVFFGLHGGAMHYGPSVDVKNSVIFVSASHVPSMFTVENEKIQSDDFQSEGWAPYKKYCASCHGVKMEGGGQVPSILGVAAERDMQSFLRVVRSGSGSMPPVQGISEKEIALVYSLLSNNKNSRLANDFRDLKRTSYSKLRDNEGFPGSAPPWGTITAIDLDSGKHIWRVPLGEHEELMRRGLPATGTENMSGPMSTAGGLVFVGGTKDKLIRAFNSKTGQELWRGKLPYIGSASPMTYMHKGKQYVVVPATGSNTLALYDEKVEIGNSYFAFALPN